MQADENLLPKDAKVNCRTDLFIFDNPNTFELNEAIIQNIMEEAYFIENSEYRKNKGKYDYLKSIVKKTTRLTKQMMSVSGGILLLSLVASIFDKSLFFFLLLFFIVSFLISMLAFLEDLQKNQHKPHIAFKNLLNNYVHIKTIDEKHQEARIVKIKTIASILVNNKFYRMQQDEIAKVIGSNNFKDVDSLTILQHIENDDLYKAREVIQKMSISLFNFIENLEQNKVIKTNTEQEAISASLQNTYFKVLGK